MLKMKILQISAQKPAGFSLELKDVPANYELRIVNLSKCKFLIKSSHSRLVTQAIFEEKIFSPSPHWL